MRRATILVTLTLVGGLMAGCSLEPATVISLDDVTQERLATVEAAQRRAVDDFVTQSGQYLIELGIPEPRFVGLVAPGEVDTLVNECIARLNPRLQMVRDDGGFAVTYFGTVGTTYDRIRLTVDSCNVQYGVADVHAATTVGWVEAAWRYQDATQRLMPCLRGIGVAVPTPPSAEEFAHTLGTAREFSPFSLAAVDPATLARAVALCPSSAAVFGAHFDGMTLHTPKEGVAP